MPVRHLCRGLLAFVLLLGLGATAGTAQAAEFKPYTSELFEQLNGDKKPVLIEVFAPWCPTCRAQKPALEKTVAQPPFDVFTVLVVDFDSQKDVLERFKVQRQSTLIAYTDGAEHARSVGFIDEKSLGIFMKRGLGLLPRDAVVLPARPAATSAPAPSN